MRSPWPLACLAVSLTAPGSLLHSQDYTRAEQFLSWNALRHVYHDEVNPNWRRDSTRFWYRVQTRAGWQFVGVNPTTLTRAPLFDQARLAAALSVAADTSIDGTKLPFQTIDFDSSGRSESGIRIRLGTRGFRCDIASYSCAKADTLPNLTRFLRSPDEQWNAFVSGYNLWVRPVAGGDSVQLTTDGNAEQPYAAMSPLPTQIRLRMTPAPMASWSPDSKRLATVRIDYRKVPSFTVVSMTPTRPVAYSYPYALPGDSVVPTSEVYSIDVAARTSTKIKVEPQPLMSLYDFAAFGLPTKWAPDGRRLFLTQVNRGPKRVRLYDADPATGDARVVLADSAASYVIGTADLLAASGSNWSVLKNGDIVWLSSRDGWSHLYRHGPDGQLKNQITRGPWSMAALVSIDETLGRVFFLAKGREPGRHPDYLHFYSVGLDGTGLTLLSPEHANHMVRRHPSGKWFIDSYSTVDKPPVVVLRGPDGRPVMELERADIRDLEATGWKPGQVFMAKGRDGVTDVWGVIWKPSNYDSTKRYPVVDHIYPGPLISPAIKDFFPSRQAFTYTAGGQVQALAELGFVVVSIDAIGNTARSKALNTLWYGDMGDHGLPDHIAAIKQLGARMPNLDLNRVGIYGISGGGFASTAAILKYPDFYKVAVSLAGNHDNRTYYHGWGERFQGLLVQDTVKKTDNYVAAANRTYASQLKGKLFLIHGDLDDNVHPAGTIGLVDALIKANKTFDFLIMPDGDHNLTPNLYLIRRTWDYFVTHLAGGTPPNDYLIRPVTP